MPCLICVSLRDVCGTACQLIEVSECRGKEWSRHERAALKVGHRDSEFLFESHPSKEVSLVIVVGNYAIRLREFITVKFA